MSTQTNTNSSSTLTVRLKTKVKNDLELLSKSTDRSRSYLAAQAIEAYVAQEVEIYKETNKAVMQGRRDFKAGRFVTHEQATARAQAIIDKAIVSKAKRAKK